MTFLELLNDFGSGINQVDKNNGGFVSGFITEDEAKRWLNQSFEQVYKWYALSNNERFGRTSYANTTTDQAIYTFGGDASDLLAISFVGVKYLDNETAYRRAEKWDEKKAYVTGHEQWRRTKPVYFEIQIYNETSGLYELGIEFPEDCVPEEDITKGLKIMYIERPPLMEEDTDIPQKIPSELHPNIVVGALANAHRKMGNQDAKDSSEADFLRRLSTTEAQEQSLSAEKGKRIRYSKRVIDKFYRYRT